MTTEFFFTLLAAATVVIAGYVSDTFSNDLAWALFGGIVAASVLSQGRLEGRAVHRPGRYRGALGNGAGPSGGTGR
jgi:hypothetical protein